MGEAKRRAAARVQEHAIVDERLRELGIDTTQFGFFDHPEFIAEENRNSEFLDHYALWVQSRPRAAEYDKRVRNIVPRLANSLADLFDGEGMQRSCAHASAMMPRILDRLGVWSFGLKGSMIMEVASRGLWRGQCMCDTADFPGAELGHAWVVAPPFEIVDATVRLQNLHGDAMNEFTPPIVTSESAQLIKPTIDDVVGAELRAKQMEIDGRIDNQLHHRLVPQLKSFGRSFPSKQIQIGELALRYVPAAVCISEVGLEDIKSDGEGVTGAEVWNDCVVPNFSEFVIVGENSRW
jgi:hypothetical protein